jgi:two-component system NtrC family sensor kinase
MRLRTNIFVWVFLATIVPLTILSLGATYYSERTYQREVDRTVLSSLENLAATLVRQQEANRNLILGISRAPALQAYMPVLMAIREGKAIPDSNRRQRRVNLYFEGFQTILPGVFILRILDNQGNTLVKVNQSHISPAIYESLAGRRYVEQEINDSQFVQTLAQLPADEVSSLVIPQQHASSDLTFTYLLQDFVVPLYNDDMFIGAVVLTTAGEELDQILDHATRLYDGSLMLLELNTDNPAQALVLYDAASGHQFAQIRHAPVIQQQPYIRQLVEDADIKPDGRLITASDTHVYYHSWLPYPNQFTSWLLASRIEGARISAPFTRIRISILLIATTALFITLLLTDLGARRIARPLTGLARSIKTFADGDRQQHVAIDQPIDEVRALAQAFNYLSETLQVAEAERDHAQHMVLQSNKLASIGQMAAGIGHEINNPLNNILSYSKLIARSLATTNHLDPELQKQMHRDLQALRHETLRASDIVKGILNFARQVPPAYSRFAVQPWLDDTLRLVQQTARSRHVRLDLDNQFQGELEGDRSQLQQALVNLMLNAIQASPEGGTVQLRVHFEDTKLIITVTDEGIGIDEAVLDNIYDPFFTTKAEGEGSGLGLSISLGIIERHNGTLDIRNKLPLGVCATLVLPVKADTKHSASQPATEP